MIRMSKGCLGENGNIFVFVRICFDIIVFFIVINIIFGKWFNYIWRSIFVFVY